jgi:putative nucleotidyltransferase with HDIG domain
MPRTRMLVSQCDVGIILSKDVKSYQGITLVAKDSVLNQYILDRLTDMGILYIWTYSSHVPAAKVTLANSKQVEASYTEAILGVKQVLRELSSGGKLNYHKITQLSELVYGRVNDSVNVIKYLNNIRDKNEDTYTHCVNVAFYSMLIAKWLTLPKEKIEEVIQAGLLHDIGKVEIPDEILNKPGKLLEFELEIMQRHSLIGYYCLKNITEISQPIKEAVLSHHERVDGSGYPYGLKGDEIDLYAKIIAIADVYDAMTQDRVYKKGVNPFVALEMFQTVGIGTFDVHVLNVFLKNIAVNFTGLKVIMENGEHGEIVYVPPYEITKPIILNGSSFIDLSGTHQRIISVGQASL